VDFDFVATKTVVNIASPWNALQLPLSLRDKDRVCFARWLCKMTSQQATVMNLIIWLFHRSELKNQNEDEIFADQEQNVSRHARNTSFVGKKPPYQK